MSFNNKYILIPFAVFFTVIICFVIQVINNKSLAIDYIKLDKHISNELKGLFHISNQVFVCSTSDDKLNTFFKIKNVLKTDSSIPQNIVGNWISVNNYEKRNNIKIEIDQKLVDLSDLCLVFLLGDYVKMSNSTTSFQSVIIYSIKNGRISDSGGITLDRFNEWVSNQRPTQ